jgi:hypothetical protein
MRPESVQRRRARANKGLGGVVGRFRSSCGRTLEGASSSWPSSEWSYLLSCLQ